MILITVRLFKKSIECINIQITSKIKDIIEMTEVKINIVTIG